VDWQVTQNHSLFARYMLSTTFWEPSYTNTGNILATTLGGRDSSVHSLAVGDTMVLSNTMVNNIRLTVNRTNVFRSHAKFFGPEDVGVNTYSHFDDYFVINVTGGFTLGTGTETESFYRPNTYAISDDLTMVRGNHQWGFGAAMSFSDWKTESNVRSAGDFSFNGGVTGLSLADFMLGRVFEYRISTPFRQDITQKYFGLYAQDTWRLSPKLTLNYGLRWEPWFPQQHQNGKIYNFSAERFRAGQRSTVYPQAPPGFTYPGDSGFAGKAGMEPDWANMLPRVGLAWDPSGDGRTSIRTGYGMNSDVIAGQFFFDASGAPPFGLEQRLTQTRFDDPWGALGRTNPFPARLGADLPFPQAALFIQVPTDLDTTRIHSWNLGVQRQVGNDMAVSATYLGNYMTNVWGDVTGNPGLIPTTGAPTGPCTLRTPTGTQTFANCSAAPLDTRRELTQADPSIGQYIGYLDYVTDYGWQRYHGLLLSGQRRAGNGISASANYTLSTCRGLINQGGNPLNVGTGYQQPVSIINPPSNAEALFDEDEGPCSNSPTHLFNLTASVETPLFRNTAARLLASGWRLSGIFRAQSGLALTVTTGILAASGVQGTTQRANQVLDDPYGDKTLNNWYNPAAFAQPAPGTAGNSERNGVVGPARRVVDLSLVRSFRFMNTQRIEARVEAFNAFNWFRWGNPITALNNANFGRIQTADDPRIMQFALKYQF
jgi:hypothetical protein